MAYNQQELVPIREVFMFSEIKVTQMASYLLSKQDTAMEYIKLLKLLYLAERKAMAKWGDSMSGDHFVSMPHGPVLSGTYDLIKSNGAEGWNSYIKDEADCMVSLRKKMTSDNLDELCPAELKILDNIFLEFGAMPWREIVDYTHNHCREWEDPKGSSYPISNFDIYLAMDKTANEANELLARHQEQQNLDYIKMQLA